MRHIAVLIILALHPLPPQAGRILVFYKLPRERLLRWVCWGLAECAIATALCGASQNEGIIPLAKNLWSPSFILLMGGLGTWGMGGSHLWS